MAMQAMYIWMNGKVIPWADAQVHVFTHALHYGSSIFEGLRAYNTNNGLAIFRGAEHYERLLSSCKMARISYPMNIEQWMEATKTILRANQHSSAYIRPLIFCGYDSLGLNASKGPIEAILGSIPWGTYMGEAALECGIDVQVSSWRRMAPNTICGLAKVGGQYVSNQSIIIEANKNGFDEGISLDINGNVSEGSGENIFLVYKGEIITPSLGSSILNGITRDCAIVIAKELGYTVKEMTIPREMLYLAEEIFFTGTAVEICPVRSVDHLPVGTGKRGPVTKAIQDIFFGITRGTIADKWNWLTPVNMEETQSHKEPILV